MHNTRIAAGIIVTLTLLGATAFAALSPNKVKKMRAEAPEALTIEILSVTIGEKDGEQQHVVYTAKVTDVHRSAATLKPGDEIRIRAYIRNPTGDNPEDDSAPMPGPRFPELLPKGWICDAYLRPVAESKDLELAVYGHSFVAKKPKAATGQNEKEGNERPVNESQFHKQLLEIAAEYRKYGREDADLRSALIDCRAPSRHYGLPRVSDSDDKSTHGGKVYFLYAKDKKAYAEVKSDTKQAAQVIVKEAFDAVPVKSMSDVLTHEIKGDGKTLKLLQHTAEHGGQRFVAGDLSGLFVMYRTDEADPLTDTGWVYGTVTADGRQVTSAGRVRSCMNCHQDAPHGRLFGLKSLETP